MGKSPKPLNFLIDPACVQTDEDRQRLAELEAQGHKIDLHGPGELLSNNYVIDICLSPRAWRAFDLRHLDLAIKSARSVKYAKKEKKAKSPKSAAGPKRARKKRGGGDTAEVVSPEIQAGSTEGIQT